MNTDISQNGKDIQLRATKEEFNATNKTLSKTVADFTTNVATGMTFTYNENGTIQSMNIGKDGIKLRGDKVDITVNKEFNVVANKVDNKVGKDEVINRLNLSPEGLDINVNKVGIRGGDSRTYLNLSQDTIELAGTFVRTWRGDTQKIAYLCALKVVCYVLETTLEIDRFIIQISAFLLMLTEIMKKRQAHYNF